MPRRPAFDGSAREVFEHLREGTRDQYESEWRQIGATPATYTFTHGLGEVPWVVDVLQSTNSDGKAAEASASYTVMSKTDTSITIRNNAASALFFRVRAM